MRKEEKFYKVIGYNKSTNEIIMLDYLFEYGDFKGATGTSFVAVTPDQLEYYQTEDYVGEYLESAGVLKDYDNEKELEILREVCDSVIIRENFETDDEYDANVDTFMEEHIDNVNNGIIDEWIANSFEEFVSQDPSNISNITDEDTEKLSKAFDIEIETYDCVGGGRMFYKHTFNDDFVSFNDELVAKIKEIEGL